MANRFFSFHYLILLDFDKADEVGSDALVGALMIYVDSNEASQEGMQKAMNIIKNEGREYEIKHLDVGDVVVSGKNGAYIIEIKRGLDLVSSINSERMWEELTKMKATTIENGKTVPIILFEGNADILSKRFGGSYTVGGERRTKYLFRSKAELKSLLARIHSILTVWNVPIMISSGYYQTGQYIAWLDESVDKEKKEKELRISLNVPKELPPERQAIEVLGAIVGAKTAMAILERYGSLYEIFRVAKEDGAEGFRDIMVGERKISKTSVKRLVSVARAEVRRA